MNPLNFQQKLAIQAPQKPLLIVAGAGTGKTRTLTHRLLYLLEEGAAPEKLCAITFTNKAAKEMASRVAHALPGAHRPFIGTFHSLGARILREEATRLGRTPRFIIFDDHDSFQLIKKTIKDLGEGTERGPAFFARAISAIKNGMLDPTLLRASSKRLDTLLCTVHDQYEERLVRNNAFDFDDLIQKVVRVLKTHPVRRAWHQKRFAHILVDEYQDINNAQYEFLRLLVEHSGNLSVVGDDQQTIYSWRGSNPDIFLTFEKEWPEAQVVFLEENYRSSGNIILAASALIAHNEYQRPKTLWTKNADGAPITIIETRDENQEASRITDTLLHYQPKEKKPGAHTVAVLYRTNAQSRALEQAFLAGNIPYTLFGGLAFYERREIKDILAALRYAVNPKDEISLDRLRKTFPRAIFSELHAFLRAPGERNPRALIEEILTIGRYVQYLEKHFTNAEERKENIQELLRYASGFKDLTLLLEQVTLFQATDAPSSQKESVGEESPPVVLSTIHMAKGLEFDRVFVAGASEGLLPHERSLKNQAEVEEERRLLYVAMTRAKHELTLSFYETPSRFLFEIPHERTLFESLISDRAHLAEEEEEYITLE